MAISVPSAGDAGKKWRERSSQATADYTMGVQSAGQRWQSGVQGAEHRYAEGVQAAIGRGAYAKGVNGKATKYVSRATDVGPTRWSQGVQGGQDAYEAGVTPYLQAMGSVTLPPRGSRGNPMNNARVQAVNEAARRVKESRG